MTKRQKLGRGLGSLLGETLDEKGKVIDLELAKIHPNPGSRAVISTMKL